MTSTDMWWESTQPGVSPAVLEAWTASILRGIDAIPCIKHVERQGGILFGCL